MHITIFDGVRDPRKIDRCTYELGDLLAVAFLTYLSKREDYADMALFARHHAREFGLFPYTDKSPSSDTFERLFAVLRTEFLEQAVFGKHTVTTTFAGETSATWQNLIIRQLYQLCFDALFIEFLKDFADNYGRIAILA